MFTFAGTGVASASPAQPVSWMRPVRRWKRLLWMSAAAAIMWLASLACAAAGLNRTTAALILILGILALSTTRDRLVAIVSAVTATVSLSYYFLEAPNLARVTAPMAGLMLLALLVTALTGSELSIRAQRRADEAERRRREIERVQQFSRILLGARAVSDTARSVVNGLGEVFAASRVVLRLGAGETVEFHRDTPAGDQGLPPDAPPVRLPIDCGIPEAAVEIYGAALSNEVRCAVASLLGLVLDRAHGFEEHSRRDAVQRGEELRTTILNAVAHDFRTPLTSIKAAASALRASSAAIFEPDRELIAIIDEEADRLEGLIRESLALARVEELDKVPQDPWSVSSIVAAVTSRLSANLNRRRLELDIPDDLPPVAGDRFLLELMLLQVVSNAWKYSSPGALIRIEARAAGGAIELAVQNEGLRIPDYEKRRIFDKFYRGALDRSRTEGSGLGLAIAKSIAEAHRGSIRLDDRADGVCFRFLLPAAGPVNDVSKPHNPSD